MKENSDLALVDRALPGPLSLPGAARRRLGQRLFALALLAGFPGAVAAQEDDQTDYYDNSSQYAPSQYGDDTNADLAATISSQGYPCDVVVRVTLLDDSLRIVACTVTSDGGSSVNYVVDPRGKVVSNNSRPRR